MCMYSLESQSIGLEGVVNARELGGYVMGDGRRVRRGLLFRGGNLHGITANDMRRLHDDFHIYSIFDFRTTLEVKYAPDQPIPDCRHVWLPTIDEATEKPGENSLGKDAYRNLEEFVVRNASNPMVQSVAKRLYPDLIENEYTQLQYAAFMRSIINNPGKAVYWHCSQGKDRTGLGSAYLLAALGADRDLIMQDFALSNAYYADLVDRASAEVVRMGGDDMDLSVVRSFLGVNVEYFAASLDMIDRRYGSLEAYLNVILLVDENDMQVLRQYYLE